mmetsp:Transcript_26227/g.80677  ORF Transcript_26227/g.80677 Transcript_26227/m.80677 type:complete len:186 (-) Transcript_26227:48-605(-)
MASQTGCVDILRLLLGSGADTDHAIPLDNIFFSYIDVARLLLEKDHPDQAHNDGSSPLLIACQECHVDVARLLLQNGADVNQRLDDGSMPLLIASRRGHVDVARLVLKNGADVTLLGINRDANDDDVSPLHVSSADNQVESAQPLSDVDLPRTVAAHASSLPARSVPEWRLGYGTAASRERRRRR